jgi:hypothetical protein
MNTLYMILISAVIVAGGGLVIFLLIRKPETLAKYWKYIAGAVGFLVGILGIAWLAGTLTKKGGPAGDPEIEKKEKKLREELGVSRKEMEDELKKAREEEEDVSEQLDEIDKIDDEAERLQRLADLWNKRRGR